MDQCLGPVRCGTNDRRSCPRSDVRRLGNGLGVCEIGPERSAVTNPITSLDSAIGLATLYSFFSDCDHARAADILAMARNN